MFHRLSLDKITVTQDVFWTEYTDFDNKNGSFDGDEFIRKIKDIRDGNSHLWHIKYSPTCTKVLGFVACIVTSNVLGIDAAEHSWGDVKTIKFGKRSSIFSDVSEKQSIFNTSACIGSDRIKLYHYD